MGSTREPLPCVGGGERRSHNRRGQAEPATSAEGCVTEPSAGTRYVLYSRF
jgi:hypothetical protein